MKITLKEVAPGRFKLPIDDYVVMAIRKRHHLAPTHRGGFYDPPLCGASVPDKDSVTRRGEHAGPDINVCSQCAALAGLRP